jgi:hypothetical protein
MKLSLKSPKTALCFTATLALLTCAIAANAAKTPHKHGTDILHYFLRKTMHNEGVVNGASAKISARQYKQGHANNQNLDIAVKDLESSTSYELLALINDDTNFTYITDFSTDAKGRAKVSFRHLGNGKSQGHGRLPLPDELNPVSLVRAVAIFNTSTQAVLTADLTAPDKLTYLIKRDLSTDTVWSSLRIKSNLKKTQFQLDADGLGAGDDYLLVLNGGIADTYTADSKGQLKIRAPMQIPAEILDLRSVALWDTSSNVVVTTTLP